MQDASSLRESTGGSGCCQCFASFLLCQARFFHGWSDAARERTRTCAHDESSEFRSFTMCVSAFPRVRARVAPQGGLGGSFRAPSACRVVIGELMSFERAQWHFVHHFSWRWRGRRMDMPMCVPDFCGPFEKSVASTDMLRTSGVPAPSVCANILVAFARRIMFQAHRAAETCERGPKGPGRSCSKMCERQKHTCGMSAHKSRSFVNMFAGQWSLPLSSRCIDTIRPSVLVKLSCRLCRLVFSCSVQRLRSSVRGHDLLQAAWTGCSHSVAPTCSSLFHIDYRARAQRTRFSPNITVEPVALCPTCWICVDAQVFQSYSDVG